MIRCSRCDTVLDIGDFAYHLELTRVVDEDEYEPEEMEDGSVERWYCAACTAHVFQDPHDCGVPDIYMDG